MTGTWACAEPAPIIGAHVTHVRAVALDVDGTLLAPDHTITDPVRCAVADARARGLAVLLTSSRGPVSLRSIQATLGLHQEWFVAYQGALVGRWVDGSVLEVLAEARVAGRLARHIETLAEHHGLSVGRHTGTAWRVHRMDAAIRREANITGERPVLSTSQFLDSAAPPHKLSVVAPGAHLVAQLTEFVDLLPVAVSASFSHADFLEVTAAGVDKVHGLKALATRLRIDLHEFAAIGDGPNDQTMLAAVGHGIAMGHALESVRRHATWLTASNSEDGVAAALAALHPPLTTKSKHDPAGAL